MDTHNTSAQDGSDPRNVSESSTPLNRETEGLSFAASDDEIHAMRKSYADALRQEFAREETETRDSEISHLDDPVSNVDKYTARFFRQNLPDAAAQIVWLMSNSESDSVRLKAAKMVLDLAREDAKRDGDPIRDLLIKLRTTPTAPATSDV